MDDGEPTGKAADRAYRAIRDAILSGRLEPGCHMREEHLAELTATSRTPVREALRRLVADGLARERNRHRFVTEFTAAEIDVMFDLRARIEGYAAGMAATRIDTAGLAQLERLIAAMDAIDIGDEAAATEAFLLHNQSFHELLIESVGSTQLERMMRPVLTAPVALVKQHVLHQRIGIRESNAQHREILRALRARAPDWAEAAMRTHVLSTRPNLRGG